MTSARIGLAIVMCGLVAACGGGRDRSSVPGSDAGSVDTGVVPGDAMPGEDATVAPDSAVDVDAAADTDGGPPNDSGVEADASATDAAILDAGSETDGGPPTTCSDGRTSCGGVCVDRGTNELHCGACGNACAVGEVCVGGDCLRGATGLVISELRNGSAASIELFNGGATAVDLAGHQVQWATASGATGATTLPSHSLGAGEFVTLVQPSAATGPDRIALSMPLAPYDDLGVRLLGPGGLGIDFVRTGASTLPPPSGTAWLGGTNPPTPSRVVPQSLVRFVYRPDTDRAEDWALTEVPSPGAFCGRPERCGDVCIDISSDRSNCGACGSVCGASQICQGGACRSAHDRLWISEVRLGATTMVELHNPTTAPISIAGYRIEVYASPTWTTTLPAREVAPGGFLAVIGASATSSDASRYFVPPPSPSIGPNFGVALFDDAGTALDFARFGTSTTAPPPGVFWFGANVDFASTNQDVSMHRHVGGADTDSAADWHLRTPSTPGSVCSPATTLCDTSCVALDEDPAHCGVCGNACASNEACRGGECTTVGTLVIASLSNFGSETLQLWNGTTSAIDLSGYTLNWVADLGSGGFTIPSGVTIPATSLLTFFETSGTSTATSIYMATPIQWTDAIAVSLVNGAGSGVDFVRTGGSVTSAPTGTTWSGSNAVNPSNSMTETLRRDVYATDSNSAMDWRLSTLSGTDGLCAAMQVTCGSSCVDTTRTATDCGACGNVCLDGQSCFESRCSFGDPRIRVIGTHSGRLELFYAGAWGTVCDDSFDNTDATVACRALGYSTGVVLPSSATPDGSSPIVADNLACTGTESTLFDCPGSFGTHDCTHSEDVGVTCM